MSPYSQFAILYSTLVILPNHTHSHYHSFNFVLSFLSALLYLVKRDATLFYFRFHLIVRDIHRRGPLPFRSISSSPYSTANSILHFPLKKHSRVRKSLKCLVY
ncbi:hypothetical protein BDR04DRAFT_118802 [Suillus decipiens]|nr:hypothetical protein BDR04DRAFT_118802 [Suillus decipiens]